MRSKQYDILLVDDDAEDRMIIGEAFAEIGCSDRVTMYDSSRAFCDELQHIRNLSPLPGLVVLDYKLPGMSGRELLYLLKNDAILSRIPVVLYSTSMSRTQKEDCILNGAVNCMAKGATFTEVVGFATALCNEALQERNMAG